MIRISLLSAAAAMAFVASAASAQSNATPSDAVAAPQPGAPIAVSPATSVPQVRAAGDIVDTAKASGQFGTFLKAVEATNLTQVLKTNKGLTVFAPTDAAFAALPPGELDRLLQPANRAELQKILTYHIINAQVDASKIRGAKGPVPTVAGAPVELDGSGEALKVNDATIVQADVRPTNGTLHVIDKVLLPPDAQAAARAPGSSAAASTGASTDTGAQAGAQSSDATPGAGDQGDKQ
ncbi:MAG: fasciclin domain-containing protein [Phenylobacterium sp.]|jgi:uncharacterized surface protein with fasciclin (FAS1) repeats|uniref:fasciclin domain-containing protein n=1 Tax=Phenylobacterium sp. TaxID=1871053 RepID=UPI002A36D17B|nr:fasciclin domain-containing protein [Phenylobacterium sp.]MDX9997089.1 fasciclin domain-containing protein [Phenylobacterium sp.]